MLADQRTSEPEIMFFLFFYINFHIDIIMFCFKQNDIINFSVQEDNVFFFFLILFS